MKFFFTVVLVIIFDITYCQTIDTLFISYNEELISKISKDSLISRYNLTKNLDKDLSVNYPIDSLSLTVIPILSLNTEELKKYNCNDYIEKYINFNISINELKVIVNFNNKIKGYFSSQYFFIEENNESADILNSIKFQNKHPPYIIDGFWGHTDEIERSKNYFTFYLLDIGLNCIVDNGKIFVLAKNKETKHFDKVPFNIYIMKNFLKKNICKNRYKFSKGLYVQIN